MYVVFHKEQMLRLISHLPSLVRLHQGLVSKLNRRISRADAKKMRIQDFIQRGKDIKESLIC